MGGRPDAGAHPDIEVAFSRLYGREYGRVLRYCRRRCDDEEAARDATAETFTITWRRWHDVPDDPLPWLYGVARRVLANQQRADARRTRLVIRLAHPPEAAPDEPGDFTSLHQALASLSEGDREVLRLSAWEDLSVGQIAVVLGCRPGSAAVRLHRARRRLTARLAEDRPAQDPPGTAATPTGGESWTR